MPEYIERDEILHRLIEIGGCDATDEWDKGYDGAIDAAISIVDCAPAADVQPVVHAAWGMKNNIKMNDRLGRAYRIAEPTFTCTNCRKVYSHVSPYCPNCGAKMDGAQNIETCICCGETIPEGRQVCPKCENK